MWADIDARQDFLNYGESALLVVDIIKDARMLPASVGVFGSWGTGKSTLLNIIEEELKQQSPEGVIVVRFDAWLYQGYDDAKTALMDVIADALIAEAGRIENASLVERAKAFAKRVKWFRVAGFAAEAAAALAGAPLMGGARAAVAGIEKMFGGEATEEDLKRAKDGAKEVAKDVKEMADSPARPTPPKQVDAFRTEFGDLLKDMNRTLVVFVDNLDRCMPEQSIRTLEAMRLFLFMSRTAFVVAADEDMVRQAVKAHFSNIGERHVTDYLDKLIQLPVRVPRLGVREVRGYLFQLLADAADIGEERQKRLRDALAENMQAAWKDEPIEVEDLLKLMEQDLQSELGRSLMMADRIAPLLSVPPVNGNPRLVKRMLNVIRMRAKTARVRKIPVSEDLIAKIALFERCTDEDAAKHFYAAIQTADDGEVQDFKKLEEAVGTPGFATALPEPWKKHAEFLERWFGLDPKVSGDLRPIAYLGRDSAALSVRRHALSGTARSALKALVEATTSNAVGPKELLKSVAPQELPLLMEALVAELRAEADWRKQPKGWHGAMILLEHAPQTEPILRGVIAEKTPDGAPAWLQVTAKNRHWVSGGGKR
jgi:predicted KAP-like P-loop ATPase